MSFEIKNDVGTMLLQQNFAAANKQFKSSMAKIATGLAINSAADDAANLALSEQIDSKIREQNELSRISQMEQAMTKVADSDLAAINDNVQRIRDLALQASNGVYGDSERAMIQEEVNMLTDEINRISQTASFNNKNLLDGSADGLELMAAEDGGMSVDVAFKSAGATDLGLDSVDVMSADAARALVDKADAASENITARRSELGSISNVLENNIERHEVTKENLASSYSTIRDTDIAQEISNVVKSNIQMQASIAMQAQANQASESVYGLLKT